MQCIVCEKILRQRGNCAGAPIDESSCGGTECHKNRRFKQQIRETSEARLPHAVVVLMRRQQVSQPVAGERHSPAALPPCLTTTIVANACKYVDSVLRSVCGEKERVLDEKPREPARPRQRRPKLPMHRGGGDAQHRG